jgi:hypothetical protein
MKIFLHFLVFLASAPWKGDIFHFPTLSFITRQQVEFQKLCLVKMKKNPLSNLK